MWRRAAVRAPRLEQVAEEVVALALALDEDEHLALLVPLAQDLQQPQEAEAFSRSATGRSSMTCTHAGASGGGRPGCGPKPTICYLSPSGCPARR